jgi:hypothetical protein
MIYLRANNSPTDILTRIVQESLRSLAAASQPLSDAVEATSNQIIVTTKPIGERPCCLSLTFDKNFEDSIKVVDGGKRSSGASMAGRADEIVTADSRPVLIYEGAIESPEFLPFVEAYLSASPLMVNLMSMLHHNEVSLAALQRQRSPLHAANRLAISSLMGAVEEYDSDLRRATAQAMQSLAGTSPRRILRVHLGDSGPETKAGVAAAQTPVEPPKQEKQDKPAPQMVERCCIRCGAQYKVLDATVEKGSGLTCSKACSYAHRSDKTREGRIATLRRLAEERKGKKWTSKKKALAAVVKTEPAKVEVDVTKPAKVRKNAANNVTRNCNICGKPYTAPQAKVDAGKRLTCSMVCSYAERGIKISKTVQMQMQMQMHEKPKAKRVMRNCLCCGRGFLMVAAHIEEGRQITCSKACSYNYRFRGVAGRDPVTGKRP